MLEAGIREYSNADVSKTRQVLAAVCGLAAIAYPALSVRTRQFAATASRSRRRHAARFALAALDRIKPGLDRITEAIDAVSRLMDYWSQLRSSIEANTLNKLLRTDPQIIRRIRKGWSEIERQYKAYASAALSAKQKFGIQ